MSRFLAEAKLRSFPAVQSDNTVRWVREVPTVNGGLSQVEPVANDTLYDELEARYGCGFAQWVVDGLNK